MLYNISLWLILYLIVVFTNTLPQYFPFLPSPLGNNNMFFFFFFHCTLRRVELLWPGVETITPAVEARSLNLYWTVHKFVFCISKFASFLVIFTSLLYFLGFVISDRVPHWGLKWVKAGWRWEGWALWPGGPKSSSPRKGESKGPELGCVRPGGEKFFKVKWAVCSFICESDVNLAKQLPFRSLGNICFTYCKNSTFRIRVYFTER